jgi:cytoskeletal protein CcmA (bactofilin family)
MNLKDGDSDKKTLVEDGTQFKGAIDSIVPIVVRGKIEGEVRAPSLRINETGSVRGRVTVQEIVSDGELSGELDADLVQLSGVVKDKTIIRAKSLQVKLAPANGTMEVTFGECLLDVGELPDKQTAINASLSDMGTRTARGLSVAPRENEKKPEAETVARNGSNGGTSEPPPEVAMPPAEMMADAPRGRKSQSPPKRS